MQLRLKDAVSKCLSPYLLKLGVAHRSDINIKCKEAMAKRAKSNDSSTLPTPQRPAVVMPMPHQPSVNSVNETDTSLSQSNSAFDRAEWEETLALELLDDVDGDS